eukprot:TRINITY_DN64417_c0_g1_i1.p1 TRINITY_DN64417_c0_g1~~TRINITY_DN64417_c0_g1_i1.p1  ORF type:complete len:702 (-),score=94.90 TRINITY_DN64417_c0_g1_i1:1527-3632(-)
MLATTSDPDSTFRIMVCSDSHLGYKEKDPVLANDSFNAFEEVLQLANAREVDFLIHGGDLFHEHKPSKETLIRTEDLLTKHVFGESRQDFKVATRIGLNLKESNISVQLPIFMIHGNHDDPGGFGNMSNIDIVKSARLVKLSFAKQQVNYMGKVECLEKIEVEPVLFQKGDTKIALYGIGYIKDERLNLAFEKKQIKFLRPQGEWFNILLLHQTKERGAAIGMNKRAYIKERTLPDFFNLVVWGHEHECIPIVKQCQQTGSNVLYVGSTVVTSLIDSEAKPKHCFVLNVHKRDFALEPIPLKSARPFIYEQIELSQAGVKKDDGSVEKYIEETIDSMLSRLKAERIELTAKSGTELPAESLVPLLRLKVEYSGYSVINQRSLTKKLEGRIANWQRDYIKFYKRPIHPIVAPKTAKKEGNPPTQMFDSEDVKEMEDPAEKQLDLLIEKKLKERCVDGVIGTDKFMEVIERATRRSDGGHTMEGTWRKLYTEINKFGNKILCEKTQELEAFKGTNLEETYNNVVHNLLNIDMETLHKEIHDEMLKGPKEVIRKGLDDSMNGDLYSAPIGKEEAKTVAPMDDIMDGGFESKLKVGLGKQKRTFGLLSKEREKRRSFLIDPNGTSKRFKAEDGAMMKAGGESMEEKKRVLPAFGFAKKQAVIYQIILLLFNKYFFQIQCINMQLCKIKRCAGQHLFFQNKFLLFF